MGEDRPRSAMRYLEQALIPHLQLAVNVKMDVEAILEKVHISMRK